MRTTSRLPWIQGVALLGTALLLGSISPPALGQDKLLWGDLKPGPHAVGFQTLWQFDYARQYDPDYTPDRQNPAARRPRPILINVWYPAKRTAAMQMLYREYLPRERAEDPVLGSFTQRIIPYTHRVLCNETLQREPEKLTAEDRTALERLLATRTHAVKEATAEGGRFPLLLYHQGLGASCEDNVVLCEYLASHGYVVANSAYPSEGACYLNVDWDLDRSFKDLDFLVRFLHGRPDVDASRLGALGHSYGAQAVVVWRCQNNAVVDAVVSIDSTVENVPPDHAGFAKLRQRMDRPRNFSVPLLLFASKENKPRFSNWDALKYAPRYEATVEHLQHDDYIAHGALCGDLVPGRRFGPEQQRRVRVSYERVCLHVRTFFDAYLKGDADALAFLQKSAATEAPKDSPLTLKYRQAAPLPPSARQLAQVVLRQGTDKGLELARRFRSDLEAATLPEAASALRDDGKRKEGVALLVLATEFAPTSWAAQRELGETLAEDGDTKGAARAYRKALELIPSDTALSAKAKEEAKKSLTETLKKLDKGGS
jgi:dienelactone hydrolase